MFPMTITLSNPAQLNAVLAALNSATEPPQSVKKEVAKPEVVDAPKPEKLVQMTAVEAEQALHGHANRPADVPTYKATADAVTQLARANGRDAAIAVLSRFGAAKLPDVKPDDFAAVIAACAAEIAQ